MHLVSWIASLSKCFSILLKAGVYKDNRGVQNLKQLERKIRACVKKSDSDPLVMLFGQRTGTLGAMEKLKPNKFFQIIKKQFNSFLIFNKSIIKLKI